MYMYSIVHVHVFSFSRIQGEDALTKLTKYGHSHFERGLTETDKQIFSLLLSLNVSTSTCVYIYMYKILI